MGKLGVTVSQNEFANKGHIHGLTGYGPLITDAALLRLWLLIDETFRFLPKKDFFFDVVDDLARQNPFHPVRDYLDTVEPTWDGTPRLDQWLSTYCGADHSAYTGAVGSLCLIAAVRRVRQPGVKFDEMVVLESAQGTDKSSALATLAKNPEWFTDDLPLNADTKVLIERTQGKWIVEAAELSGLKKSDIEGLKALLSRREDRARPAYGRLTIEVLRQCVFVGTTNNATYLTDPTGNRRFWPVAIAKFDLPALKRDLDQLWGEAAHREAAGESIRLDPSLWGVAAEEQDARRIDDPMAGALDHHLCGVTGKIRTVDLWQLLDVSLDQRMRLATPLAKAMQELGWTKTKVRFGGPNPERGYVKGTILERQIQLRTNKFGVALDAPTQKDAA